MQVGHAGCRDCLQQTEMHVLGRRRGLASGEGRAFGSAPRTFIRQAHAVRWDAAHSVFTLCNGRLSSRPFHASPHHPATLTNPVTQSNTRDRLKIVLAGSRS